MSGVGIAFPLVFNGKAGACRGKLVLRDIKGSLFVLK